MCIAGPEAVASWRESHGGTAVLTLDEAFELGRLATQDCLDAN